MSGDRAFSNDFFSRFIEGRELVDYTRLLARAGFMVRKRAPGRAFGGQVTLQPAGNGFRITGVVPMESPLYKAGAAQDDQLVSLGSDALGPTNSWEAALARHKAGDRVAIRFVRRSGEVVDTTITFDEDPRVEIVLAENSGGTLTDEQRRFRNAWLGSLQKR